MYNRLNKSGLVQSAIGALRQRWQQFRTWQIGDCVNPAGTEDRQMSKELFKGIVGSTLPVFNGETLRMILQLLLRPGYMMREYLRGKRDGIMPPLTTLIIFFAFLMVLNSMVGKEDVNYAAVIHAAQERFETDSIIADAQLARWTNNFLDGLVVYYQFRNMDQFPELIDTHSERLLAGIEGWLRGQGILSFFKWMILLTLGICTVGHRRYRLSFSASATIGAYMLCQLCIYNFVFTIFSLGGMTTPLWIIFLLLWMNIYQLLGVDARHSLGYTILLCLTLFCYWSIMALTITGVLGCYAYYIL